MKKVIIIDENGTQTHIENVMWCKCVTKYDVMTTAESLSEGRDIDNEYVKDFVQDVIDNEDFDLIIEDRLEQTISAALDTEE
ncbi:MAG: hypothetical protein MJZ34_13905 [Paludibacteraceae bacterium]|nr:hypothetical protein [Paludibacteraceae bacterium]